jgi:hypothetical protein
LGKWTLVFHEESFILAERTHPAGIANSLTGDTLAVGQKNRRKNEHNLPILTTEKLTLRELSKKDSQEILKLRPDQEGQSKG